MPDVPARAQGGFSLVELMVTVAIAAILLALGLSSFRTMMASNATRAAAESIAAGLQMARSEAIRRNAPMRFQLVSNLGPDASVTPALNPCAYSAASMIWVVTQTDQHARGQAAGLCNAAPYTPPDQPDPCSPLPSGFADNAACQNNPWIAFKSTSKADGAVSISAYLATPDPASPTPPGSASVVTFGPIGQLLTNLESSASLRYVKVAPASDTSAKTWGVRIGANGSIKICDPSKAATDPMGC